jgi:hypothetical protein
MNPPIQKGVRVVVAGNLQPYARAVVADCVYKPEEARWAIILEWPDAPGGPNVSRVWDTDEGRGWYRYADAN